MTKITRVKSGSKLEEFSSYSRAVAVGDWILLSNTAGRNPDTQEIPEDLLEQTHQVFTNIERALEAVGSGLADVVQTRVYLKSADDAYAVMEVHGAKFRGIDPVTTVTCPPMASDAYKVEIEVTAWRGAADLPAETVSLAR
ncbi:RidA family protein [Aurantiacibacter rhizosphaerae]|uniref:RidA family protein n=1 Tax=Aurantiacibacter rhizosphaerae TaxID=2691582 RepID=A0A844XHM2_9SPHN|nr:RidA family protein [Aurantiacibacter rhizosphaerae]MWV29048.1 RidA family protein [Aurantiacibacter rhizosphaerae]